LTEDGLQTERKIALMRILLMLPTRSAHWSGLANLICESDALRDDITLVVEGERVRFFDAASVEIPAPIPGHVFDPAAVSRLDAKLSLFRWLHERFPKNEQPEPRRAASMRIMPAFARQPSRARNIRMGNPVPANRASDSALA
jgi:hypothetical protein